MPGSVVTVQLGQCGNQVGAELASSVPSWVQPSPETISSPFSERRHPDVVDPTINCASPIRGATASARPMPLQSTTTTLVADSRCATAPIASSTAQALVQTSKC